MAGGMNAAGAATSPARSPDPAYRLRRAQHLRHHPMGGHGASGHHAKQKLVVLAAGPAGGKTGIPPSESCSRALPLRAPSQPAAGRFTGPACGIMPVPRQRGARPCTMPARNDLNEAGCQHGNLRK
jgi:hypothetical protein